MAVSVGALERRFSQLVAIGEAIREGTPHALRARGPLPEELIPDAVHFMNAILGGESESDYAHRHPQTYARLRQAVER